MPTSRLLHRVRQLTRLRFPRTCTHTHTHTHTHTALVRHTRYLATMSSTVSTINSAVSAVTNSISSTLNLQPHKSDDYDPQLSGDAITAFTDNDELETQIPTPQQFLQQCRKVVQYVQQNKKLPAGVQQLNIVFGNEASDLDSMVSALVVAYTQSAHAIAAISGSGAQQQQQQQSQPSTTPQTIIVPICNCRRSEFFLRGESTYAFSKAGITENELIFDGDDIDLKQLQQILPSKAQFGIILVDHNTLAEQQRFLNPHVIAIYDHHKDSGEHLDIHPRIIETNGSGVSLPTAYAMKHKQMAKLLKSNSPLCQLIQSVIMIDTDNFSKETNKALPVDVEVFQFCQAVEYRRLMTLKKDVTKFSTLQLLQRDTKFAYASTELHKKLSYAIASIPTPFEGIVQRDSKWQSAVQQFIDEKHIDFMVILTSFSNKQTGKHQRQLLTYIPHTVAAGKNNSDSKLHGEELQNYLDQHLTADQVLALQRHPQHPAVQSQSLSEGASSQAVPLVAFYEQTNVKASRKQVMPLVDSLVAKL